MLGKTPTGVEFFDAEYGGAFRGRPILVSGPAKSGKSVIGMQFIARGLKHQEHCLYLSAQPARDVAICADSMGLPFMPAVEAGQLVLLEYSDFIPGRDTEKSLLLNPEAFQQLQDILQLESIVRVVIDTVLPWVALPNLDHLAEHIYSFVRAFERLNVTALFTMPRPASVAATRLHRLIEEVVPISIVLLYDPDTAHRSWLVNKYLGATPGTTEFPFEIRRDVLVVAAGAGPAPAQEPPKKTPGAAPKSAAPETPRRPGTPRISLADSMFDLHS